MTTMVRNKNARVLYVTSNQVFNVGECYDVPYPVAHAYKRRMARDPKYNGGILCVNAMPQGPDRNPSL